MKYDDTSIAERYDSARQMSDDARRVWTEAIGRRIPKGEVRRIVDVGCGTGRYTAVLAEMYDADILGIDPSRTMLAKAMAGNAHPRVRYLEGEAARLPVEDNSCCLVFLSMVYHHIADTHRAALEFARALRPGGRVCIRNSMLDHLDQIPYQEYFPGLVDIHRAMLPSSNDIAGAMRSAGLSLTSRDVIPTRLADSFAGLYDKIVQRAMSDLIALPDTAFQSGLRAMRDAMATGAAPAGPILEPIDLLVFSR